MAKLYGSFFGTGYPDQDNKKEVERVADASEFLIRVIAEIDRLAKPKQFKFTTANVLAYNSKPSDESRHKVRVMGCHPVDETVTYQVYGEIGDKTVNVVATSVFHTYSDNGSGSKESILNGREMGLKPEYGGLVLADIYQDSELWSKTLKAMAADKAAVTDKTG